MAHSKEDALAVTKRCQRPPWPPGSASLYFKGQAYIISFAESSRKAAVMDFYIAEYQSKPTESLTSLFQSMTDGVHRLEGGC